MVKWLADDGWASVALALGYGYTHGAGWLYSNHLFYL